MTAGLGIFACSIAILLDFSTRSLLYLIRMNRGQWLYLKV